MFDGGYFWRSKALAGGREIWCNSLSQSVFIVVVVDGCHHLQTTTAAADFFSLDGGGGAGIDKRLLLAVVVVVVHNCKQRSCTRSTCVAVCKRMRRDRDRKKLPFRSS